MDINASTLRAIYTGLNTAYNARFTAVEPFYNSVALTTTSTSAQNEYPRLDDIPGFREWIGDRVINSLGGTSWTLTNKSFERTIGILRDKIEDDNIGIFSPVAAQMGGDAAFFPDTLCFPLLKSGETNLCYDGQYFFDTDHPSFDANGQQIVAANYVAGANPAWYLVDDSQVMKPLIYQIRKRFNFVPMFDEKDPNVFYKREFVWGVDGRMNAGYGLWQLAYKSKQALTLANYATAKAAMTSYFRRDGAPLNIRPKLMLVPPALELAAKQVIASEKINGGENNPYYNDVKIVVIPALA